LNNETNGAVFGLSKGLRGSLPKPCSADEPVATALQISALATLAENDYQP